MRTFQCACGARIFFENSLCTACGRELGFVAERAAMCALEPDLDGVPACELGGRRHRKCRNYSAEAVCNWLVAADEAEPLCQACRLNRVVPDLSQPGNRTRWADMEAAKRRLLYALNRLGLPVVSRTDSPDGLVFDIKADTPDERAIIGHDDGLITLNVAEADPVLREKARVEMAERYRTLLGHFRHEIGHYYWDRLVRDGGWLEPFRSLFGDERSDYEAALRAHYETPRADWTDAFISPYASVHPWEDWAETWAHYLHITDTLETAHWFGFVAADGGFVEATGGSAASDEGRGVGVAPDGGPLLDVPFEPIARAWAELAIALNALNRSMGMPDPYPFQHGPVVQEKLALVHRVVAGAAGRGATA